MPDRSEPKKGWRASVDAGLTLRFPSEARRIVNQHEQLDMFAALVSSAVDDGSLRSARAAFTSFSSALDAHITMEDQTFFPAISGLNSGLHADLTNLVAEHVGFRERLDDLHDQLARGSVEEFRVAFDAFCIDFTQHEAREERVVARTIQP